MSRQPLAVALQYEAPHAPRVIATGRGEIGQAIIDTAREHGVPLEQNPELAEALSTIPLDDEIPEQLYRAVAAVIAFILNAAAGEMAARSPIHRQSGPATGVAGPGPPNDQFGLGGDSD